MLYERPVPGAAAGGPTHLAAGDVTCDGAPDVVVASPVAGGVYVFTGLGNGDLAGPTFHTMAPGAWDVALGDLDEDGILDVVTANETSSFSVRLARCGGAFTGAETYPLILNDPPLQLPEPKVAVGDVCPGQPGHLAAIVGLAPGRVYVTCGDGSGSFDGIVEPHGQQVGALEWDYFWGFNQVGNAQELGDVVVSPEGRESYVLIRKGAQWIGVLVADDAGIDQNEDRALRFKLGHPGVFNAAGFDPVPTFDSPGGRILYVGAAGLGVLK